MFYGWGENAVDYPMPDGRTAVCVYKYFSLLFVFKLARSQRWYIVEGQSRTSVTDGAFGSAPSGGLADGASPPQQAATAGPTEVQRSDLAQLFAPEDPPSLGLWHRFGIVIPVLGILLIAGIGAVASRGTTSVVALEVGDCFIEEGGNDIERLTTPPCSEPHDSQITAIFDTTNGPAAYPADSDRYWDTVFADCLTRAESTLVRIDDLPDTAQISFLSPNAEGWDRGDREIVCFLWDEAGLDGSFVATGSD